MIFGILINLYSVGAQINQIQTIFLGLFVKYPYNQGKMLYIRLEGPKYVWFWQNSRWFFFFIIIEFRQKKNAFFSKFSLVQKLAIVFSWNKKKIYTKTIFIQITYIYHFYYDICKDLREKKNYYIFSLSSFMYYSFICFIVILLSGWEQIIYKI